MFTKIISGAVLSASLCSLFAAETKPAADKPVGGDPLAEAQHIPYHMGQTPTVPVALKWKTIVVLPSTEKILDVVCGFKDDWDVYAPRDSNFAMVQPLKAGARTDLAFVTKAGNIYTFAVKDVSGDPNEHAFTQVLVEAVDDKMRSALNSDPKYYSADDVAAFKAQAQKAEEQKKQIEEEAQAQKEEAQARARAEAGKEMKDDYKYNRAEAAKQPWGILSILHDDKFSYVTASPTEQFAVYEVVDGKPTVINIFPAGDGSFRTDRVISNGYFQLGKKKLTFSRVAAQIKAAGE